MARPSIFATVLLAISLAFPSLGLAQETASETPAETPVETPAPSQLQLGEVLIDGVPVGTTYTKESFGDWDMRCVLTENDQDPCQLYQLMQDANGNSVAEISLFELVNSTEAIVGATIAVPLETLLTEQVTLSVDDGSSKRYPFSYCALPGCYARIGMTASDIEGFKRGAAATVVIVPVAAPTTRLGLKLSLSGFTDAFAALQAANAALAAQ